MLVKKVPASENKYLILYICILLQVTVINTPALVLLVWTLAVGGGTDRRDAPGISHLLTDPLRGKACPEASSLTRNFSKSFEDLGWDTA